MRPGDVLKNLMLGLIYPAVLGSIIYLALTEVTEQAVALWGVFSGQSYEASLIVSLKFLLLWVTLIFYCCDYLYLLFTNDFNLGFFLMDFVFIIALYATVLAIGIDGGEVPPKILLILACYTMFMLLYLGWDLFEKTRCSAAESGFYDSMIRWELWSLLGLGVLVAAKLISGWAHLHLATAVELPIVVAALAIITYFFARHTWRKRLFIKPNTYEAPVDQGVDSP
jgi:hypothetical protein